MATGARRKARVWTAERVALWQRTGRRPSPVMVWTPDPDYVTRHFARLVKVAGLPPVRVHDLRHGAATLASGVLR